MAYELIFKGSNKKLNKVDVAFGIDSDGYVYVRQPNEEYELLPSILDNEDIKILIDFLKQNLK